MKYETNKIYDKTDDLVGTLRLIPETSKEKKTLCEVIRKIQDLGHSLGPAGYYIRFLSWAESPTEISQMSLVVGHERNKIK